MEFDVALPIGEGEVEGTVWTGEFPFPQDRYHGRGQGDCALSGLRLGCADLAITVRALPDMQFGLFEVDVLPAQATHFRCAKAGENGGEPGRPPCAHRSLHDRFDFVWGRNIDASL